LINSLPDTPDGNKELKDTTDALFNGGHALSRFDSLAQVASDRLQQPLLESAFNVLGPDNLGDPQQWVSRLNQLPQSYLAQGTHNLASAWAGQSPEQAAAWAQSLTPGDTQNGAFAAIASTWASSDPQGTADWVASLPPGAARDRSTESLVLAVAQEYPQQAWDWALTISDPAERDHAASQAAQVLAARDPAALPAPVKATLESSLPAGNAPSQLRAQ
jgi:hypothetical protein